MWIFTKYGFYSAVCARQGDGSSGQPIDPERLMVRARVRAHLDATQTTVTSSRRCTATRVVPALHTSTRCMTCGR